MRESHYHKEHDLSKQSSPTQYGSGHSILKQSHTPIRIHLTKLSNIINQLWKTLHELNYDAIGPQKNNWWSFWEDGNFWDWGGGGGLFYL